MRKVHIFVFAFLAAVGLVVASVLLYATSESGATYISERITRAIQDQTGMVVSFRDLDLDLLPPSLVIKDLQALNEQPQLTCSSEEVEVGLAIIPLLKAQFAFEEIYLGTLQCSAHLTANEATELFGAEKQPKKPTWDLSRVPEFGTVAITDAELDLSIEENDLTGAVELRIDGLGLDITGRNEQGRIEARALIKSVAGRQALGLDVIDEEIRNLKTRIGISSSGLSIRWFGAEMNGAVVDLKDGHLPLPDPLAGGGLRIEDIALDLDLAALDRLPMDLPQMSGNFSYKGSMALRSGEDKQPIPSGQGRLRLLGGQIDEYVIGDLDTGLALTEEQITLKKAKLQTAGGTLAIDGSIGLHDEMKTRLSVKLDSVELARVLHQAGVTDASWVTQKTTGAISLAGTLQPLRLDGQASLQVTDHTVSNDGYRVAKKDTLLHLPHASVAGHVTITDSFFAGRELDVDFGQTHLDVEMKVHFDTTRWSLVAESPDLHLDDIKQIVGFDVGGHGPIYCKISGLINRPRIVGKTDLTEALFAGFDIGHAKTEVEFRNSKLAFKNLDVRDGPSRYTAEELLLDFNAPGGLAIATQLNARGMTIDHVARTFNVDRSQWGDADASLEGTVDVQYSLQPESLSIAANVRHKNLVVFGERFGPGLARGSLRDNHLEIEEVSAPKGSGSVQISGTMTADEEFDFTGIVTSVPSSSIDNKAFHELDLNTSGQAYLFLRGTLDKPTGNAHVRLGDTQRAGFNHGPSNVKFELDWPKLSATGALAGDKVRIETATIDLDNDGFSVDGRLEKVNLLGVIGTKLEGHNALLQTTAAVHLEGALGKRPSINGDILGEELLAKIDDLAFINREPISVTIRDGTVRIKKTRLWGPDVAVDVSGTLAPKTVDLRVRGLASLKSLSSIFEPVEKSTGKVSFTAAMTGPWTNTQLAGSAKLTDGRLVFAGFPHPMEEMNAHAELSGKRIKIESATAKFARGKIGLNGEILLDGLNLRNYEFHAQADDLELTPIEDVHFSASTTLEGLTLKKPPEGELPTITGDVLIRDLKYTHDIRVLEWSDLNVERLTGARMRAQTTQIVDESADFFAYDINLHGDRNLVAANNLFDVDLKIDDKQVPLRIVGTNQTIGFLGRVLGPSGQVRFAGKQFDIKYASLTFQDPLRPENPEFLVRAEGQIRDWKIILTAEGTVDNPKIKFNSQPYLSDEDIIFVILTGMSRAEHSEYGGIGIGAISSPIISQLTSSGELLPVEFRVYTEYSERLGTTTTRVGLSRKVTDDIYVSVSSNVGAEQVMDAQVNYRINDKFSLAAAYEDDNESHTGNVGLDLKFRLEF